MKSKSTGRQHKPLPDKHASPLRIIGDNLSGHGGIAGFCDHAYRLGPKETVLRTGRMLRRIVGAMMDRGYDRRHGTDTCGCIEVSDLDVAGGSKRFSQLYMPTPERSFRLMLDSIPLELQGYSFVDYGCGKGRTLMIGAEMPFRRIIGIEHSTELACIASRNVASYRNRYPGSPNIDVLHIDASEYLPPPGPCFFYFYSPFYGQVLEKVVDQIHKSYQQSPRAMVVLFSEDINTIDIPICLFETTAGMTLLAESAVSRDIAAPTPLTYAIFANAEAMADPSVSIYLRHRPML
jgi:SAM-dependent methyltransferase